MDWKGRFKEKALRRTYSTLRSTWPFSPPARIDTKKEAMEWGRDLTKREGLELIHHGTDGKIQNPNSYGNDPCPPKDTRH